MSKARPGRKLRRQAFNVARAAHLAVVSAETLRMKGYEAEANSVLVEVDQLLADTAPEVGGWSILRAEMERVGALFEADQLYDGPAGLPFQ